MYKEHNHQDAAAVGARIARQNCHRSMPEACRDMSELPHRQYRFGCGVSYPQALGHRRHCITHAHHQAGALPDKPQKLNFDQTIYADEHSHEVTGHDGLSDDLCDKGAS